MTNLSPSARHGAARRTAGWQFRTTGLCVAGAGAALIWLLVTPLAHADADGSSFLLAAAATDLPDSAAATGYSDLSNLYVDVTSFENSNGLYEDALFFSDLTSASNILSATGFDIGGDRLGPGESASDYLSAIEAEDTTLTGQLTDLEQEVDSIEAGNSALALTANQEADVILGTSVFQEQINYDIDNLPTITAQDETNPALISELSALYNNEIDLSTNLTNLGDELEIGSPAGITQDNAAILSEALGMANDAQSSAETLTILADLSSIGL